MSRYHEIYQSWQQDPERFWAEAATAVEWYKAYEKVFDPYAGQYGRWFTGGSCNTVHNCLDRHVTAGRGAHDDPRLAPRGIRVPRE